MKTKTIFAFYLILLLVSGCKKDNIFSVVTEEKPPAPKIIIESTVSGIVLNRQGQAVENATVTWGTQQVETNEDGFFIIEDEVNGEQAVLQVSKEGYFDAFQTILPIAQASLKTRVQLTPRLLNTSFSAANGGELQLVNGTNVTFVASAFQDEMGNTYTGEVRVFASYIDPTDPDLDEIMPGNLQALNADEESQILESFGMINVELEGSQGQGLQITSPAQLSMPIPTSLLNKAPSAIPLWYFDEATGLWKEEGEATLSNGNYVGELAHFSFWNCDVPYDLVEISGKFTAESFEINGKIKISAPSLNTQAYGHLSSDGSFRGKVISGTPLTLELIDLNCNDVIYTQDLGTLTADQDLGEINIPLTEEWVTISGTLVNCDDQAISEGVVVLDLGGNTYLISPKADGSVLGAFRACNETDFSILGVDWNAQERGQAKTFNITSSVNVGNIQACGTSFVAEMRIIIPGQDDYVVNNVTATIEPQMDSIPPIYKLNSTDIQGENDRVTYNFNFLNWTNNQNNQIWGMNFDKQVSGAPGNIFRFSNLNDIVALQYGEKPGEVIYFRVSGVTLFNEVTELSIENCTLELSAILE